MDNREKEIRKACSEFIDSLGENATNLDLFWLLKEVAERKGLILQAHQKGIGGTLILFSRESDIISNIEGRNT